MLEALFGNRNIQNILLFLFVNGKCYGAKLQSQLQVPLTPIQKALERLEKGEILTSCYEGKTRIYQFNPSYPFLEELELLLKKAYSLLPPQEKKRFSYVMSNKSSQQHLESARVLKSVWKRLQGVTTLAFHARTKLQEGWSGQGKGVVNVAREGDNVLHYYEKGSWHDRHGQVIDFTNAYRWTLDTSTKVISLEHLRRGINNPVFLFHLAPDGANSLSSIDCHLCAGDAYYGKLIAESQALRLKWRAIGPKKNEEMEVYYS